MTTIANLIALLVLAINMTIFFGSRYHITKASKHYSVCLMLTLATALFNTFRVESFKHFDPSPMLTKLCVSLDLMLTFFTTSALAMYLITKVCEHVFTDDYTRNANIALGSVYAVITINIILNLIFGYMFTTDTNGAYTPGKYYFLVYVFLFLQSLVIMMCSVRHRYSLTRNIKLSFIEAIVVIALCLIIKTAYSSISVLILIIVLIELIFFLNFHNNRVGVNSLTNLNGSRGFSKEVNNKIKRRTPFKAYLIKLKNIGDIKQNLSHRAGDEILYLFAFELEKVLQRSVAFNMYGTTFAIVVPTSNAKESKEQTKNLITYLEKEIIYKDESVKLEYILSELTWSDEANADILYEKLEYASDIAKNNKTKYIKCTLDLEIDRLRRKYLIDRMQNVDAEHGFELWFQPIYSVKKDAFSSAEVLLRLRESDGKFISPAEFIPLAEKTGQIVPITWFVIRECCRLMSIHEELANIRASINLPMTLLSNPSFDKKLNEIVDGYGVPHDRISFEFTERVILDNLDDAECNMRKLQQSGYTFYLDDFGVGYSNFNCVLNLPLKTIKLDMSLTSTAERLKENYALVNVLTGLFHGMGLNVVAEGAETAEQVELLRAYGVDGIQGYYFAKPMPVEATVKFLSQKQIKAQK